MKQTHRERIHSATLEEIKSVAWQQIAQSGASSLSLRAIAREMEMTAPALYRYFKDRDALVTALIVEAFISLGNFLMAAREAVLQGDHAGRLMATGIAYREWALTYPQRYTLIFGTPISGYQAPSEITVPAASRSLGVLIEVLEDARRAGELHLTADYLRSNAVLLAQIEAWRGQVASQADPISHYLSLVIWSRVHGLASLEIYQQYPPTISELGEIYRLEMLEILKQFGMVQI
jgi:AcrR family transcriptional regulator